MAIPHQLTMQVLDDDQLESLECSKCHKYLSVFPVKNHVTRDVTCGRCSSDDDDRTSSLYKLVAERYLFRCVNRYEGCRKLLRMDETEAHERECIGNVFTCAKCRDSTKRSVLELIWHYKLRHPTSYLRNNTFEGKVPTEDAMLYIQGDVVFFILLKYESQLNVMYMSAVTLTEVNCTQTFLIGEGSVFQKTDKRPCKSLTTFKDDHFIIRLNSKESIKVIFNIKVLKSGQLYSISLTNTSKNAKIEESTVTVSDSEPFTIQLTTGLKKRFEYKLNDNATALVNEVGHKIDLACSNCKRVIGLPLFRCKKLAHKICYGCRTWCGICNCSVIKYKPNQTLVKVTSLLRFACKWKCGEYFTSDLHVHERVCRLRIKKCPDCLTEVCLELMETHLLTEHGKYYCEEYDADKIEQFICNDDRGKVYFLLSDKWCCLKWSLIILTRYNLRFILLDNEPNANMYVLHSTNILNVIDCSATILGCNLVPTSVETVHSCKPYLKFN